MDVFDKAKEILENHHCYCYNLDKRNRQFKFVGKDSCCCSINTTIADLTGYLLTNNIEYNMGKDYSIVLIDTNE